MRSLRLLSAAVVFSSAAAFAVMQDRTPTTAEKMALAADKFLASLSPEQKAKAVFAFDDPERLNWHFVPRQDKERKPTRKGVRLEELTDAQQELARELLRTGTSPSGYAQATTIMSLEDILLNLEKNGAMVRNKGWYFVSIFGTPGKIGSWGWRIEGHHLSLNYRIDGGEVTATTPFFFGANPALVKAGDKLGLRTLADVEDAAVELFEALTPEQKKAAYHENAFPEIEEVPAAKIGTPVGIPGSELTPEQKRLLQKLLDAYLNRLPAAVASAERASALQAGLDAVHFAWNGGTKAGEKHTYRVQGPTFVIEFLNVQADSAGNPANHIHSVWRSLPKDFGDK